MKKIYSYIMLCVWACVALCCSDEELGSSQTLIKSGDEVQFGLSLSRASSRTIYGDRDGNFFPVYWVNGDKVQIMSPQCLNGRNNAEYKVTIEENETKPDYAESITKTGAAGVQWGESNEANFYSVYPSGQYTVDEAKGVIENLRISEYQEFELPDLNKICKPKMTHCLMYAKSSVKKTDEVVNLVYAPISTSIRLTLKNAPASVAESSPLMIQSIRLEAFDKGGKDVNIVGNFAVNLKDSTFNSWMTDGKNADGTDKYKAMNDVVATIGGEASTGYYILPQGGTMTLPLFIAPQEVSIAYWKVHVYTDKKTFTKTIKTTEAKVLKPGMVHELTLPTLSVATNSEWDVSNWMTNIPRNVYLSEISIPGSWNSLNKDFQGVDPSIEDQYASGVRAFHLDTRWKTSERSYVSFMDEADLGTITLAVADGGTAYKVNGGLFSEGDGRIMNRDTKSFAERLKEITEKVRPDEYMILFCSFAQRSYNNVTKTGKTWMAAVSEACSADDNVYDASTLTPNTVVGDVLGKVIVIVNCEGTVTNETLPQNSRCLFCNIPNTLTSDYFPASGSKTDNLYASTTVTKNTNITMAISQAQITSRNTTAINGTRGYYPTFAERTTVVNNILDWSKTNYNTTNYAHNQWIFLGLGGNTANSSSDTGDDDTSDEVVDVYTPLIDNRIAAMGNSGVPYYPVGIVFLNYTVPDAYTDPNNKTRIVSSSSTVKNILMLNNSYRLQYDPTKPAFPNTQPSAVNYDGYNINGGNAITTK